LKALRKSYQVARIPVFEKKLKQYGLSYQKLVILKYKPLAAQKIKITVEIEADHRRNLGQKKRC